MSQSQPRSGHEIRCQCCRAPNDPAASECWLCKRPDWRPLIRCRHCKSPNDPTSWTCWLCKRPDWRPLTDLSPIQKRARLVRSIARSMIVIAAIAAFLALAVLVPLVAFLLVVYALPAWLVTEKKDLRRHERGEPGYSPGRKFVVFLGLALLFHIIHVVTVLAIAIVVYSMYI